jgi:acetyl esterase
MTSPTADAPDTGPLRAADLQLRGAAGAIRSRVYWPRAIVPAAALVPPGLLVWFPDPGTDAPASGRDAFVRALCSPAGMVVVVVGPGPRPDQAAGDAVEATAWIADHARELGADAHRLAVGGEGAGVVLATLVARRAAEEGWPPIGHRLLVRPGDSPAAAAAVLRAALAGRVGRAVPGGPPGAGGAAGAGGSLGEVAP